MLYCRCKLYWRRKDCRCVVGRAMSTGEPWINWTEPHTMHTHGIRTEPGGGLSTQWLMVTTTNDKLFSTCNFIRNIVLLVERKVKTAHNMPTPTSATQFGNRSCSQPCRHQQDQKIQPTIRNSHLHSSCHWNSWYLAPLGSWAGPGTGKAGDHNHRRLQRDHLYYLFQQLSAALQKGNAISFQNTFTAGYSLLQPVIYLY